MTDGYVDAGSVRTYYEMEGQGEPLILLHGGFSTIDDWRGLRSALAERFRVYMPERRGHGRTPDVPGPTGFDIMASDTVEFMRALEIGPAHLVGWSDGGLVSLEVALRRPDLVRKLVLIGTAAHVDGYTPESVEWTDSATPDSLPPFIHEAYARLSPDGADHFPVVFDKLVAIWRTEPRHEMIELGRVAAPTLLMLGDDDGVRLDHAAQMKRAIPDAQLAVVPGTDHFVVVQKPELVSQLLLEFLAD
jgi:pimeloyl-ACP methyl ester carboxylesterase